MSNQRKRQLTAEEQAECTTLKAIWESRKKEKGLTQAAIGDSLNISQAGVSQYLNGTNALNMPVAVQFSRALGVPISDFSPRLEKEYQEKYQLKEIPAAPSVGEAGEINIPQYNTGGMGGNGLVLRDQPGIIQKWSVSHEWLRANVPHHTSVKNLCIVTGFGDSMPETYSPGDPLIVDLGVTVCDHDGIYFFRVGDEGFIKRLQRIPGQGILVLSQNKEYRDWTITPDMDFEVFGKVLRAWKGRNY